MGLMKRNIAIILLVVTLVLMGLLFTSLYTAQDKATVYLADISGERSLLEEIRLSGYLEDGFHQSHFTIEQGRVGWDTQIYALPRIVAPATGIYGRVINNEMYMVTPFYFDDTMRQIYEVTKTKDNVGRKQEKAWVLMDLAYPFYDFPNKSNEIESQYWKYDEELMPWSEVTGLRERNRVEDQASLNYREYGLAQVGENFYFTVTASRKHRGINGIYSLEFGAPSHNYLDNLSTALVHFDLGEEEGATALGVLGLEAVGDKLILLLEGEDELLLKAYDSSTGQLEGQLSLPNFKIWDRMDYTGHHRIYETFVDDQGQTITLAFDYHENDRRYSKRTIISLDVSNGVELLHILNQSSELAGEDISSGVSDMLYRNGRLYVARATFEEREEEVDLGTGEESIPVFIPPNYFMIYVFEQDELVYQGELLTDMKDDLIRMSHVRDSYGYNYSEHRNFYQITIE